MSPVLAQMDRGALLDSIAATAAPDQALLATLRLAETGAPVGPDHPLWDRVVRVLGGSRFWGDLLIASPAAVEALSVPHLGEPTANVYARMEAAVAAAMDGGRSFADAVVELRRTYRRELIGIVSEDLDASAHGREAVERAMPRVSRAISDLVGATLDAALLLARRRHPEAADVTFTIIAMGKTGAEELNYISDVDVIYVCDGDETAVEHSTQLATTVTRIVSEVAPEAPLWPLDANLRPEGKDGPLVRTLDSHLNYYRRWAHTWEFQALLKARPVAGDMELGERYLDALRPLVWTAVERENFVEDSQAMRRRVEEHVRARDAERQLKLGPGGLRDVEFTVQLLQLVHGRTDESLRVRPTLEAIAALATGGYVGRDHAAELQCCYQFLRALEHRIQLDRMRRSHVVPSKQEDLARLSRLMGVTDIEAEWTRTRRRVRDLHESIFYRPLLPLTARLTASEVSLDRDAAVARLTAIGYRDPNGAMRHIAALTDGVSRRAAIQRQLLPVMLGWFTEGPKPDAGLLEFRKFSEQLGGTHWYLKLLRDSGTAAERLASVFSSSTYVAQALSGLPESVMWLADDADLEPRGLDALWTECASLLARRTGHHERIAVPRYLRRRELTRAALGDVLDGVDPARARPITDAADVAVRGALAIALDDARDGAPETGDPAAFAVVAMGRMGGREMAYASDSDVMFVYEPRASEQEAVDFAMRVAQNLRGALMDGHEEPPLTIDVDLRPEGRRGPMVRSLDSYAEYYSRWAEPWERQALLRARPIAGDPDLRKKFVALIDPVRYREGGLDSASLTSLRRMKARVESERMPRGVEPKRHLKLGPGGLTDVEFTVQLLQLQHAGAYPELRTTETVLALEAARHAELIDTQDALSLRLAWELASRVRDAIVLATGRTNRSDVLPGAAAELAHISRVLGYGPGRGHEFEEDYLRVARRARKVVEAVFFG